MLRPQLNTHRDARELNGWWDFRAEAAGDDSAGWSGGVPGAQPIAVPGCWNEQIPALRDFCGAAWYQTEVTLPAPGDRRRTLRFGSVNYAAEVWVNGEHAGGHSGGHLPFELDVSSALTEGRNRIVVRVDNELRKDRVPPGSPPPDLGDVTASMFGDLSQVLLGMFRSHPTMAADFFPYGGIHRPVVLTSTDRRALDALRVVTSDPRTGTLRIAATVAEGMTVALRVGDAQTTAPSNGGGAELELVVPDARPWGPGSPVLYDAELEVRDGAEVVDRYSLPVGLRTVAVDGSTLLLNSEPVVLRGFGRHEDYPIAGRGHFPVGNVRDYSMMTWMGANSFRTSHYPYSEEQLDLADRLGFLVISETPAVGLEFGDEHEADRIAVCRQMTSELIERDRNRPSVIMWSLANEPMAFNTAAAVPYFEDLVALARSLDDRPVTIVNPMAGGDPLFAMSDVVAINRYSGWYSHQGQIEEGTRALAGELDALHARHGKPIIVTEFGCDTLPGHHADPPEMFSEEYQAEFLESYLTMMDTRPFVAGQHIWNLADFKTGQGVLRPGSMNHKGVLTRDRRPKLAAHRVRALWVDGRQ